MLFLFCTIFFLLFIVTSLGFFLSLLRATLEVTITILQTSCAAAISNPYSRRFNMFRNPNERNSGKLLSLSEFLNLAKNSTTLSGVLISVEVSFLVFLFMSLHFTDRTMTIFSWPCLFWPPSECSIPEREARARRGQSGS